WLPVVVEQHATANLWRWRLTKRSSDRRPSDSRMAFRCPGALHHAYRARLAQKLGCPPELLIVQSSTKMEMECAGAAARASSFRTSAFAWPRMRINPAAPCAGVS